MQERLQKILSRAGVASRRAAEKVMAEGRVTVNGETVRELGSRADVERDDIRVDGVRVRLPQAPVYLLLNKPKGVVTTRHDPEGRPTVMDLVPAVAGLFPVGRLDVTTEGLLILTNDGAFAERIAHPRYEVARVYHAKVRGLPDAQALAKMRAGVMVEGERLAADRVRVLEAENNAWVEVAVHEGRRHEVRRLLEAVGHPVSKLRRVAIGPITDRGLDTGQFRQLTPHEVRALTSGAPPAPTTRPSRRPRRPRRPQAPGPTRRRWPSPDFERGGARGAAPGPTGARRPERTGRGGRASRRPR